MGVTDNRAGAGGENFVPNRQLLESNEAVG